MGGHCTIKCQGLYLGSPCKDSWFEVDQWVIKIMKALGVAVPLALGENQCLRSGHRCDNVRIDNIKHERLYN